MVVAAGIVAFGDLVDTDDVVIEELFLTNAMGPMWLAKHVAPALQASQGFFVNLSGVVAESPMPGMAVYSASKAAAAAATEAIRREFRRMKVAVIDVRPPHTETGLATRPLAGQAPKMPVGLEPSAVAERIVTAIEQGDTAVASTDFGDRARHPCSAPDRARPCSDEFRRTRGAAKLIAVSDGSGEVGSNVAGEHPGERLVVHLVVLRQIVERLELEHHVERSEHDLALVGRHRCEFGLELR